jgi:excisionase family DNA binding protein
MRAIVPSEGYRAVEVPSPKYINRINAARYLDCSEQLIDKFLRNGKLTPYYLGRKVLLLRSQVEALVERRDER